MALLHGGGAGTVGEGYGWGGVVKGEGPPAWGVHQECGPGAGHSGDSSGRGCPVS